MNWKHYAIALILMIVATSGFALTLYSIQSGTWGPGGTAGLFNTASDGSGISYDGSSTLWSNASNDLIIQAGHTIIFKHTTFDLGNLTVDAGSKLYTNDMASATNFTIRLFGSTLNVKGEIGNGIPANPADADRIAISMEGGTITGAGTTTLREFSWDYSSSVLNLNSTLNIHYYDTGWQTWYLYPGFGSTAARDFNIMAAGALNIYGNFTHDYDLRFAPGVATNASDISGKLNVDGKFRVYEGNILMKTDNSSGQDFNVFLNSGSEALFEKFIYCNRGSGDPLPYIGAGKVGLIVTGTLECQATDPIQYSSTVSFINMRMGSKVKLSGGANQILDEGVDGGRYYDVELDGTGPKTLAANVDIDNQLIFTNSGIQLGNFNLTMSKTFAGGSTSDVFQNSSDTKFIETNGSGAVKAAVPAGGFFNPGYITWPIGNGTYNELIFENYGITDNMSIRVENQVLSNGNSGSVVNSLVVQKTWNIKEDAVGGQSINVTFMWAPTDESNDFNRMDTWISHHDGSNWDTDSQGTGAATASGAYYTRRRNGITSFSPFSVFSNAALLPVELIDFSGKEVEQQVVLDWQTAIEIDNKQFAIEHSKNGKDFIQIGTVAGAGNSTRLHSYQFKHYNPINGINYYRLKQEDFSGAFEFSPLLAIDVSRSTKQLSVYPTLASEFLNYLIEAGVEQANLEIINPTGQILIRQAVEHNGENNFVDISSLEPGTYWVILKTDSEWSVPVPFFKQ